MKFKLGYEKGRNRYSGADGRILVPGARIAGNKKPAWAGLVFLEMGGSLLVSSIDSFKDQPPNGSGCSSLYQRPLLSVHSEYPDISDTKLQY
jgi:hypothetical protein